MRKRKEAPERKLRAEALKVAKERLKVAIEWLERKEIGWALVEIEAAEKLVQAAKVL